MTWAIAALHGLGPELFGSDIRSRLEAWIDRGVRVLAPRPGGDLEANRRLIDWLGARTGPTVAVDLVDSSPPSARSMIDCFESRPELASKVPLLCSRAASVAGNGSSAQEALQLESLICAVGGTLAVSVADLGPDASLDGLLALNSGGLDRPWIGLASGFPAADLAEGAPADAPGVLDWLQRAVPATCRSGLAHEAAEGFLARLLGR